MIIQTSETACDEVYFNFHYDVDETTADEFQVYPNPTTGVLHVEADGLCKVEVIDAVGRVVISQNDAFVNMSALNNGIYSVRLTTTDGILVKKVAKR